MAKPTVSAVERPALIGDIIQSLTGKNRPLSGAVDTMVWYRVVGRKIAARTSPTRLSHRVLYVAVGSAAWAQELTLLSAQIVQRLQAEGMPVDSLRFHIDAQRAARREPPPKSTPRKPAVFAPLSSELKQRIDRIEDEELKQAVLQAAELWFGARQTT